MRQEPNRLFSRAAAMLLIMLLTTTTAGAQTTETLGGYDFTVKTDAEACMDELIQYLNALLVVSPDAALEETAQYIQQDFNKVEAQYQQSRKHGKKEDSQPDGGKDDGEGGDVTPVTPEA